MDTSEKPRESNKTFNQYLRGVFKLRCFHDQFFVAIFRLGAVVGVMETLLLPHVTQHFVAIVALEAGSNVLPCRSETALTARVGSTLP